MLPLILIALAIAIAAYFFMRSSAPPPLSVPPSRADALALREVVLAKLRDRMVGWDFETLPDAPLEIIAIESATERRRTFDLGQLLLEWQPLHSRGETQAAETLVEDFAVGASGEAPSEEGEVDTLGVAGALALKLVPAGQLPKGAFAKPAGTLQAMVVLRKQNGFDPVTKDDLATWNMQADDAFQAALENLRLDVSEGLRLEAVDDDAHPTVVELAPGDPLAQSYALIPELATRVRRTFEDRPGRFYFEGVRLLAAVEGTEVSGAEPADPSLAKAAESWSEP